jgi:hypothetical protein
VHPHTVLVAAVARALLVETAAARTAAMAALADKGLHLTLLSRPLIIRLVAVAVQRAELRELPVQLAGRLVQIQAALTGIRRPQIRATAAVAAVTPVLKQVVAQRALPVL